MAARRKQKRQKKRSDKGALLKGMSRRLPSELIGDLTFEVGLSKIMRNQSGVYALYDGDELYYVGLGKNLYWRLLITRETDIRVNGTVSPFFASARFVI